MTCVWCLSADGEGRQNLVMQVSGNLLQAALLNQLEGHDIAPLEAAQLSECAAQGLMPLGCDVDDAADWLTWLRSIQPEAANATQSRAPLRLIKCAGGSPTDARAALASA
jgi:hypothetical protein